MKHCFERAHAKINLTLDILGTRQDGYHELCMVMQRLSLHDTLAVRIGCPWEGVRTVSNLGFLPNDGRNLVVKAAEAFLRAVNISPGGVHVALHKRIPVSAGLAGGSADAAAVLHGLNRLCETHLSVDELCEIGLALGADVPYCIRGGTQLARGVGEILSPLPGLPACWIVLCKPGFGMSTPKVYAARDQSPITAHPDTAGMVQALEGRDLPGICARLCNVLEPVVEARHPEIGVIRQALLEHGALGAMMSGSGSTVFGIFSSELSARRAREALLPDYPDTFLTTP